MWACLEATSNNLQSTFLFENQEPLVLYLRTRNQLFNPHTPTAASFLTSHCGHQPQISQPGGTLSARIFRAAARVPSRTALFRSCHSLAIVCYLHEKCNGFLSCAHWTNIHIPADTPAFALNRLLWVKAGHGLPWLCPGEGGKPDRNRQVQRQASGKLFIHKQVSIIRNRKIHLPHGKSDRSVSRNTECLHRRLGVTVGNHSTTQKVPF